MYSTKKTVFFAGRKIRRLQPLVGEFRKLFDEVNSVQKADYVVHVDRDGTAPLGDLVNRFNPKSIAVVSNPLGINPWNGTGSNWEIVRISIGSLSPDRALKINEWDENRWPMLAEKYNLHQAKEWVSRPDDFDVVLLLPKLGGWLGLSGHAYCKKYTSVIKEIRTSHPKSRIVVRVHPRNVQNKRTELKGITDKLSKAASDVVIDKSPKICPDQLDRTKLVACDWSTAVYQFVMRGIPITNPDHTRPNMLICNSACGQKKTVHEVMNEVCQSVIEVDNPSCLSKILSKQVFSAGN